MLGVFFAQALDRMRRYSQRSSSKWRVWHFLHQSMHFIVAS
jgi:hypothetical protein